MTSRVLDPQDLPTLLSTVRDGQPIEIEVGCGSGHFISEYGICQSSMFLIGVDLKQKRCLKAVKKINRLGLGNVHIVCGRAEALIRMLPVERISAFHIYFPDPWPKNRHRPRRFFRMPHLSELCRRLRSGGKVYFSTDFFDYYFQAKILILLHPQLGFATGNPPPETFSSIFSKKYLEMGKPLYFASAVKTS